MIQFLKSVFFILASIIMAVCLLFIPESSGAVSFTYTAVLGVYLGLDIAGMIAKTATLPAGKFKPLNIHKYVVATICLITLVVISVNVRLRANITTAMTAYISSAMIILTCLIGGLEGNKIATSNDGSK